MKTFNDRFGSFARFVNAFASSTAATALAFVLVVIWALSGSHFHYSNLWQLMMNTTSSVITFLMVFVLNNAQSRDTSAINAKLDSIIFAMENADNRLIGVEHRPESEAKARIDDIRIALDEAESAVEEAEEALEDASAVIKTVAEGE